MLRIVNSVKLVVVAYIEICAITSREIHGSRLINTLRTFQFLNTLHTMVVVRSINLAIRRTIRHHSLIYRFGGFGISPAVLEVVLLVMGKEIGVRASLEFLTFDNIQSENGTRDGIVIGFILPYCRSMGIRTAFVTQTAAGEVETHQRAVGIGSWFIGAGRTEHIYLAVGQAIPARTHLSVEGPR